MKLHTNSLNSAVNFQSNFYTVNKRGNYFNIRKISTDNEENLGKEPVLQTNYLDEDIELPMTYDGKYYTADFKYDINKYRIYYKDTGKYEKEGKEQVINPLYYTKIATREDRKYNDLPSEQAFAKGKTEGKVFVNTSDIPENIPAILILDEITDEEMLVLDIPHNVKGIITSSCNFGVLSHCANLTRNRISAISIIWDEDKFNDLKKQKGKYIAIDNNDGILKYDNVKQSRLSNENITPSLHIIPPKLENVEHLLDYDELTPQNCGNKGYRIGVMQKLIKNGELKNINLPKGFIIPEGYINNYKNYIDTEDEEEWKNRILNGIYTQDTENKIKELNLPRQNLIIRSNFNTEDLSSFSSAGIYESKPAGTFGSIIDEAVFDVINYSLNESKLAEKVHEKYGIKNKDIQPSVIIQEKIRPDYNFTVYSDDGNNNILIEMSDYKLGYLGTNPALIKYNKKTKELSVAKKQSPLAEYMLDESGKITDQNHPQDKISENWEDLKPLLNIVTDGALTLEKYFNHPQDIEGGIGQDGKVYFWQTRDIVSQGKI
jgi:hypothetical protein